MGNCLIVNQEASSLKKQIILEKLNQGENMDYFLNLDFNKSNTFSQIEDIASEFAKSFIYFLY